VWCQINSHKAPIFPLLWELHLQFHHLALVPAYYKCKLLIFIFQSHSLWYHKATMENLFNKYELYATGLVKTGNWWSMGKITNTEPHFYLTVVAQSAHIGSLIHICLRKKVKKLCQDHITPFLLQFCPVMWYWIWKYFKYNKGHLIIMQP
jgi:hypothetical protein